MSGRRRRHGGGGGGGGGGGAPGPTGADRIFIDVSYWEARAIQVATALDLFTLLADGPSTAEDVAVRLATDKRATELLLNALVEIGYLLKKSDRFSNAPHAQAHLVRGQKGYVGFTVLVEAQNWNLWGRLDDAVKTGKRPDLPKLYRDDAERTRTLLKSLHARAEALFTRHVVEKVKLENATTMLDLGGGAGSYSIAFARRWPKLTVTLFDLPLAIEVAKEIVGKTDVHKRVTLTSGDWHTDPLGGPYDVAFLSNVIHSESEEGAKALLKKVAESLVPGGRLVIRDMFLGPERAGPHGAVFSLNMLLNTDAGRCYSAAEVGAFLKDAGLGEMRITEPHVLMEARKPGGPPREEQPAKPQGGGDRPPRGDRGPRGPRPPGPRPAASASPSPREGAGGGGSRDGAPGTPKAAEKSAEAAEQKPAEQKPAEQKPAEQKPAAEASASEQKPAEAEAAPTKPEETSAEAAEQGPAEPKPAEAAPEGSDGGPAGTT